jgi:hypothetical protein
MKLRVFGGDLLSVINEKLPSCWQSPEKPKEAYFARTRKLPLAKLITIMNAD